MTADKIVTRDGSVAEALIQANNISAGINVAGIERTDSSNLDITANNGIDLIPDLANFPNTRLYVDADANYTTLSVGSDKGLNINADNQLYIYPDYDDNPTQVLRVYYDSSVGGDSLKIAKGGTTHLVIRCDNGIHLGCTSPDVIRFQPDQDADPDMTLDVVKNGVSEIELLGSTGDSIGIESKDKIELRGEGLYLYPE